MTGLLQCPCCRSLVQFDFSSDMSLVMLRGPWPTQIAVCTAKCSHCSSPICFADVAATNELPHAWITHTEQMMEGEEYDQVFAQPGGPVLDGSKPITVVWVYHPMPGFKPMEGQITRDLASMQVKSEITRLLVLPDDQGEQYEQYWGRFDAVWRLRDHMTADAVGPFTSCRAEKSLMRTLWTGKRVAILHYWPSTLLNGKFYRRLFPDEQLARLWSEYCRLHVWIEPVRG